MNNPIPSGLPIDRNGDGWTPRDISSAREWFASALMEVAFAVAYLDLKTRGFPRYDLAEDAVCEWLSGKVDPVAGLLPPRFFRAIRHFDPSKGEFVVFLLKDLKLYVSGTFLRRFIYESRLTPIDEIEIADPCSSLIHRISLRDLIRRVMESLDERDRRILSLCNEGHSTEEIAGLTGTTTNAVKTAICRARSRAREEIDRLNHERRRI